MIEETIRASGKFQVEIKSDYRLERDRTHTAYSIETYAFVPNSLDVNPETYPKYLFYRDTHTYIRLKMPILLLQDIAAHSCHTFEALEKGMDSLANNAAGTSAQDYGSRIRLFCCVVKYSIKSHLDLIAASATPADAEHLVEYYHDNTVEILRRYRLLGERFDFSSLDESVRAAYLYADEYCSMFVEQYAFDILEMTRRFGGDNTTGYRKMLLDLVRAEQHYRSDAGYPSQVSAGSDNEGYVYRRGMLKRAMESILFLTTRVRPEGRLTEQVIFSLAAGLAMVFATAVAFVSQQKYGNFTMAFFVALVISYMFKDRIKELARIYVNEKVQRSWYFDQKVHIYAGSVDERLGYSRESFRFVPESGLPANIVDLRKGDPFTRLSKRHLGEQVFLYRKNLKIFTRNFDRVYHDAPVDGLTDIWRVSMARFVRKMDNPKKLLFVIDNDGYRVAKASKVYHINLVIRYIASHGEQYRRFRVVLTRNGIKRIEKIDGT